MRVILQKDVPNLGDAGEIKEVANGYARNFLLPRKMVIPYRSGSARAALHQQQLIQRKVEKRTKDMEELSRQMGSLESLDIKVRVGAKKKLFGSVTTMQVAQALKEKGFDLDKRKIEMGDKIRALGTFKLKVRLAENISVPLEINVIADEASMEAIQEEEARVMEEEARLKAQAEAAAQAEGAVGEDGEAVAQAESGETGAEEDADSEETGEES